MRVCCLAGVVEVPARRRLAQPFSHGTLANDAAVVGYRVYYGTAPRTYSQPVGAGLDAGLATTYVVTSLQLGYTYYFAVTAVDATGNESAFSNEASKQLQ